MPSEFVELAVPATEGPLELTSEEAAANKYVHPFFLNAYAKNGRTPLMIASSLGSVEIVRYFVRSLYYSQYFRFNIHIDRLLLESGRVDVNLPISSPNFFQEDNDDQYCSCSGALLEAVKHQHGQIVHLLQDFGALDYGNRAVALALTTSNSEIIGSLLSKLACADSQNIVNRFAPPAENQSPMLANLRGSSSLTLDLFTAPFSRRPAGSSVPSSHKSLVGVQLNWQNTGGLAQLQFEWFLAAAANFNKHFLTRNTQRY